MLIVQKYGGTSVGNLEQIKKVAEYVVDTFKKGNKVVVVVSAMAGETDRLLKLAQAMGGVVEREIDSIVSTGEQVSAALTSIAINNLGTPAVSLTAPQIRIVTDSNHQRARMKYVETVRILNELDNGKVVVITGFQGVDEGENITTIGRGGSDTSAVAIASALHADVCEIYTDVDGVFSADPNICSKAKRIHKASYEELLETAGAGAKVIHAHAVELAARRNVPMDVKLSPSIDNARNEVRGARHETGTHITREEINMDDVLVSTVTHTANEARISIRKVPNKIGLAARIFEPLARTGINIDMIVENVSGNGTSDISFTVAKSDLKKAIQLSEAVAKEIGAERVEFAGDVAKVSIVGIGMRTHAGVAHKMFETLAGEGIDIQMISTSEIKVSVVVDRRYMEKAVRALHEKFINTKCLSA